MTSAPVTQAPVTSAPVTSAPSSAALSTESPTSSSATCPPAGTQVDLSSGSVSILQSSTDTICGVYISTGSSLIPFARSYDGKDWEAAPGPRASQELSALALTAPFSCQLCKMPFTSTFYSARMAVLRTERRLQGSSSLLRLDLRCLRLTHLMMDRLMRHQWPST